MLRGASDTVIHKKDLFVIFAIQRTTLLQPNFLPCEACNYINCLCDCVSSSAWRAPPGLHEAAPYAPLPLPHHPYDGNDDESPIISTHSWYFDPKNQRFIYGVLVRAFGSDKGNRCVLPALHAFSTLVAACARSREAASWRRQGMDHVGGTSRPENVDFPLVL